MKNTPASKLSIASLLFINISIPVVGILLLDWSLKNVLVVYWAESAIIGFYTVLKIRKSEIFSNVITTVLGKQKETNPSTVKTIVIFFFIIHFGMFMTVHFLFLSELFALSLTLLWEQAILLFLLFLFISHGISYIRNYIGKKEYKTTSLSGLSGSVYNRIVGMHVAIVLCGFIILLFGENGITYTLFIGVKTAIDTLAHIGEHTPKKDKKKLAIPKTQYK